MHVYFNSLTDILFLCISYEKFPDELHFFSKIPPVRFLKQLYAMTLSRNRITLIIPHSSQNEKLSLRQPIAKNMILCKRVKRGCSPEYFKFDLPKSRVNPYPSLFLPCTHLLGETSA